MGRDGCTNRVVFVAMSSGIAGAALRHGPCLDAEETEEVVADANSLTGSCGEASVCRYRCWAER